MIRYYYTKLKLFVITLRALRSERKTLRLRAKLEKLQTMIAAGFTSEKEFQQFNKRLLENRKRELDPEKQKQLEELRKKHFNQWKPKKRFKDSKDKQAQREANQRQQQHTEYVRVLKNRPIKPNPDDLVNPKEEIRKPIGENDSEQKGQ